MGKKGLPVLIRVYWNPTVLWEVLNVLLLIWYSLQAEVEVKFSSNVNQSPKIKKKKISGLGTCPVCKTGKILENSKSFYCTEWRNGCKYSIWKNTLERYGKKTIEEDVIRQLLKDEKNSGLSHYIASNR